jgi:hypothetical protein
VPAFEDISIHLRPGVDTQKTLALNEAALSVSQLIRYKEGLVQKYGGWTNFYGSPVSSTPVRDVHAFQGLQQNKFLASGSLTNLTVISCGILRDITPQTNDTNPTPSFSVSSGSNIVTVKDPGSSAGQFFGVRFDTPVRLAGQVLSSAYKINTAVDANTYTIAVDFLSSATVSSGGTLPKFSTTAGSAIVDVNFPSAAYFPILGLFYPFRAPTSVGGQTIQGPYQVSSVIDSTDFQLLTSAQSSATAGPVTMNASLAALHYYNTQGPPATGGAYGAGPYGGPTSSGGSSVGGAYGLGTPAGSGLGTPITVADWALDNTGEILLAVPKNGPLYYWAPDTGFTTAQVVTSGPLFNIGGFVSQPQQIVMMFGSCQFTGQQDPLIMRWSDSGDFTIWAVTPTTFAGSFHLPTGSTLVGAIQAPLFGVAWTDIDVWTITWAGQPLVWAFLRVGTGCGLIGQHAADVFGGAVLWAGTNNFYTYAGSGVEVLPCSVWDFFFQNIDRANQTKVRAASNSQFNEVGWFFPLSLAACTALGIPYTGENNAYVKVHVGEGNEYEWDYGILSRSAWVDTTVLGPPIGVDNFGNLLQHETAFDASGAAINAYMETGYFALGDGTNLAFVDWVIPDIRWQAGIAATTPGTLLFTFYTTDYPAPEVPGGSGARPGERVYGPFPVTQATQFINTRMRGRFWRCRIESNDQGSFWRIGKIKFRWGPSGRR